MAAGAFFFLLSYLFTHSISFVYSIYRSNYMENISNNCGWQWCNNSLRDRRTSEDSDYFSRDSSSDGSSDSERDRGLAYSRGQQNQQTVLQEGFSSDDGEYRAHQGCLLFEYLEHDQPYGREPLADKASSVLLCSIHRGTILISFILSSAYSFLLDFDRSLIWHCVSLSWSHFAVVIYWLQVGFLWLGIFQFQKPCSFFVIPIVLTFMALWLW